MISVSFLFPADTEVTGRLVLQYLSQTPAPGQRNVLTTEIPGEALAQCLQESDCIMVQRHTPRECLSSPLAEELPMKCQQLRKGFGECK